MSTTAGTDSAGDLAALRHALDRSGLLRVLRDEDGFVVGAARVPAADVQVNLNIDPELDEYSDVDTAALLAGVERILTIEVPQWRRLVVAIAAEIDDAVGDEPVEEEISLGADLLLRSIVVFRDATLLSFDAPKQFPDSWIRVQLDDEFGVDDVMVEGKDADADVVEFASLDDVLDDLSSADGS
ncbi:cytochrome C5 [Rhodococcus qingshengii]|uniref:cytochrome C5 n=1 Tax=Rhodococcus qingshengii TaxID=334542 RepID=UPI001A428BE8|nr:cytochrome C5 [Rhodococcus qingshengii]ULD38931.1 cytochrome C5 [Rhodococcus qingshengii]